MRAGLLPPAVLASLLMASAAAAETRRDPRAVAIVDALTQTIAPGGAWEKAAGLKFTFVLLEHGTPQAQYRHTWDIRSGRHRLDWTTDEGIERICLIDTNTKSGRAFQRLFIPSAGSGNENESESDSEPAVDRWITIPFPPGKRVVDDCYRRFINDTYWLLMPLKMKDPGVNLDFEGEAALDTGAYDIVKLTFDNVGLTPGDTYWVYVNRKTHLVDRWDYVLQGEVKEAGAGGSSKDPGASAPQRTTWRWLAWESFGSLRLPLLRNLADFSRSIQFKDVEVLSEIPPEAFDSPLK